MKLELQFGSDETQRLYHDYYLVLLKIGPNDYVRGGSYALSFGIMRNGGHLFVAGRRVFLFKRSRHGG